MTRSPAAVRQDVESDREWLQRRFVEVELATSDAVFVHTSASCWQAPGGGEVQLIRTARELEDLGVPVRPFRPWSDRLARGQVLHLFGMSREGLELARIARARGTHVVLSPICWFDPWTMLALERTPFRKVRALGGWMLRRACPSVPSWRRELLTLSDRVLPNSRAEADQLQRLFGVGPERLRVVPNGVEPRFADADPEAFRGWSGLDGDFVLYVGRIEPRKNVLRLILAARQAGLPLAVLGAAVPGHEGYARACRTEGGETVRWLGRIEHDDPRLASAYAAARVLALPSWFETPGLAALEAALAGTAVVLTPRGCTREVFGDRVVYAEPDRVETIARALRHAWEAGPTPGLAEYVATHFLWSRVARITAEVYDELDRV